MSLHIVSSIVVMVQAEHTVQVLWGRTSAIVSQPPRSPFLIREPFRAVPHDGVPGNPLQHRPVVCFLAISPGQVKGQGITWSTVAPAARCALVLVAGATPLSPMDSALLSPGQAKDGTIGKRCGFQGESPKSPECLALSGVKLGAEWCNAARWIVLSPGQAKDNPAVSPTLVSPGQAKEVFSVSPQVELSLRFTLFLVACS